MTGLIVPANSTLVPSVLGLRPQRMLVFVSFLLFFLLLFSSLMHRFYPHVSLHFRVHMYTHGYVPDNMSLQAIRDGFITARF